jgi:hypothetical protein
LIKGCAGSLIAEAFAIMIELHKQHLTARISAGIKTGPGADLNMADCPYPQLDAGTVAGNAHPSTGLSTTGSTSSTAGSTSRSTSTHRSTRHHKVEISSSFGFMTNSIQDIDDHLAVLGEIAGAERNTFPGLETDVFSVTS